RRRRTSNNLDELSPSHRFPSPGHGIVSSPARAYKIAVKDRTVSALGPKQTRSAKEDVGFTPKADIDLSASSGNAYRPNKSGC
ncbi:MAG: hypothetical protein WCB47_18705, partial [Pseudolabrys sp.]